MKEKCQKKKSFKSENGRELFPLTPFCYSTLLLNFVTLLCYSTFCWTFWYYLRACPNNAVHTQLLWPALYRSVSFTEKMYTLSCVNVVWCIKY